MASVNHVVYLDDVLSRFLDKVEVVASGCHEWTGGKQSNGYGRFSVFGKSMYAHRFSALMKFGIVSSDMDVCHKCDNRKCVNPEHLFIGTRQDNMRDCKEKGRLSSGDKHAKLISGEKSSSAKLTKNQVEKIRWHKVRGFKTGYIANMFGVSTSTIRLIANKKIWRFNNGIS